MLTLTEQGSEKTIKYQGPLSIDLVFIMCKFTLPRLLLGVGEVLGFREVIQKQYADFSPLDRAREQT